MDIRNLVGCFEKFATLEKIKLPIFWKSEIEAVPKGRTVPVAEVRTREFLAMYPDLPPDLPPVMQTSLPVARAEIEKLRIQKFLTNTFRESDLMTTVWVSTDDKWFVHPVLTASGPRTKKRRLACIHILLSFILLRRFLPDLRGVMILAPWSVTSPVEFLELASGSDRSTSKSSKAKSQAKSSKAKSQAKSSKAKSQAKSSKAKSQAKNQPAQPDLLEAVWILAGRVKEKMDLTNNQIKKWRAFEVQNDIGFTVGKPNFLEYVRDGVLPNSSQVMYYGRLADEQKITVEDLPTELDGFGQLSYRCYFHAPYNINTAIENKYVGRFLEGCLRTSDRIGFRGLVLHVGKASAQAKKSVSSLESRGGDITTLDRKQKGGLGGRTLRSPTSESPNSQESDPSGRKQATDENPAVTRMRETLLALPKFKTPILLETPCGQQNELLTTPEELGRFVRELQAQGMNIGLCIDTCHIFVSGITPSEYLRRLGDDIELIQLFHYNGSRKNFGCRADGHAMYYSPENTIPTEELVLVAELATSRGIPLVTE